MSHQKKSTGTVSYAFIRKYPLYICTKYPIPSPSMMINPVHPIPEIPQELTPSIPPSHHQASSQFPISPLPVMPSNKSRSPLFFFHVNIRSEVFYTNRKGYQPKKEKEQKRDPPSYAMQLPHPQCKPDSRKKEKKEKCVCNIVRPKISNQMFVVVCMCLCNRIEERTKQQLFSAGSLHMLNLKCLL